MSLREQLADRFFGDVLDRRVEARVEALRGASNRSRQVEGFRRLTDVNRDLNPVTHDRQREIAVYLYTYNPLARRMLETIREWILGEGATVTSPHPRTQDYLDGFWTDRVNRWPIRLWEQTLELFLMGERFWPVFTNQFSGLMRFGVTDPASVKEVVLDPDNVEVALGVVLKSRPGVPERRYRAVLTAAETDVLTGPGLREWEALTDGELFISRINRLSTQSRGISEIFSLADWLDGYEQLLFSILQREQANAQVMWDVELQGMSDEDIQKWLETQSYPKPLSIRAHNEKVKWELQGPAFGSSSNNVEHARLFRNHLLGGIGIPEHWFGGGGDVNRATAAEMGTPTEKSLTAKQRLVKNIIEEVIEAQVARGIEYGAIPDDDEAREFQLEFPEPSTKDLTKISSSLQQFATGLSIAAQEGWVDDATAVRVMTSLLQQTGVEADPEEMLARAQEQKKERLADEAAAAMDRRLRVVGT